MKKYTAIFSAIAIAASMIVPISASAENLKITQFYPGSDAENVPINTGIELLFSNEEYSIDSVASNVTIEPEIKGSWEKHKNTAAFVPADNMEYDTKYSVTVSAGLVGEEFTWGFNTEQEQIKKNNLYLNFIQYYGEYPSNEKPSAELNISGDIQTLNIKNEVYSIDAQTALKYCQYYVGIDDLPLKEPMLTFDDTIEHSQMYNRYTINIPQKLAQGFYVLKSTVDDCDDFTILQITDIAAHIEGDGKNLLVWTNDIKTGNLLKNIMVLPNGKSSNIKTDNNGIAKFEDTDCKYIKLMSSGKEAYYPVSQIDRNNNKYRSSVITDRNLYKPKDVVYIWGTARDFSSGEELDNLKAEIYNSRWWYYNDNQAPILTTDLENDSISFSGKLELPNIGAGSYYIQIKDGDECVASKYITVNDYVKPDYKMTMSADKNAIFYGDKISYKINTSFFEGTPVPNLAVSYRAYSMAAGEGGGITNNSGDFSFEITPEFSSARSYYYDSFDMSAYATLPEGSNISSNLNTRVFYNNIMLSAKSEYKNGTSTVKVHSDTITLDRLNDGSAKDYFDYTDKADSKRKVNAELYKITYKKIEDGTYYDYITKKTRKRYRYEREETKVRNLSAITDSEGNAELKFAPINIDNLYYEMRISTKDDFDRDCRIVVRPKTRDYIEMNYDNYSSDRYYMEIDKEKYNIGDNAVITVTKGIDSVKNDVLFVKDYNGIEETTVSKTGRFETTFNEIPSAWVHCIVFEPGRGYVNIGYDVLEYDYENSRLEITATTDKQRYAPGDDCVINVSVRNLDGKPEKAAVNLSVVDEALLALRDNNDNMLEELYQTISMSVWDIYSSHTEQYLNYASGGGSNNAAPMASMEGSSDKGMATVRSDFKDTAIFKTVNTDENGNGSVSFKLPDNITSWRAVLTGLTADLSAGKTECSINSGLPYFINTAMSENYLKGDKPQIGINLFGDALSGNETVEFKAEINGEEYKAAGKAFERINIPIGELDNMGENKIVITAYVNGEAKDSIEKKFNVLDTYNKTDKAVFYDSPFDAVRSGESGNVKIIFTDNSAAALVSDIWSFSGGIGDRIDQKIVYSYALKLWYKYMESDEAVESDFKEYQNEDGGLKLFPYGNTDFETTIKLAPFVDESVDKYAMAAYLNGFRDNTEALYALACLGEDIAEDIEVCKAETTTEKLYKVLAFYKSGNTERARELYNSDIAPIIESVSPYKRVRTGSDDDDIISATALAALAAIYIGNDDAQPLYQYTLVNYPKDVLVNIEKLLYIEKELEALPQTSGSVTYSLYGKEYTKDFYSSEGCTVTVPAEKLSEFKVISATESVKMTSISQEKEVLSDEISSDVKISRHYETISGEESNSFAEGDIIKVLIKTEFANQAMNGGYVITDYLPSGLKLVNASSRGLMNSNWYITSDNQKIKLYAYDFENKNSDEVSYYARVVSAGEYTADNAIIQSNKSTDIIAATSKDNITIK